MSSFGKRKPRIIQTFDDEDGDLPTLLGGEEPKKERKLLHGKCPFIPSIETFSADTKPKNKQADTPSEQNQYHKDRSSLDAASLLNPRHYEERSRSTMITTTHQTPTAMQSNLRQLVQARNRVRRKMRKTLVCRS